MDFMVKNIIFYTILYNINNNLFIIFQEYKKLQQAARRYHTTSLVCVRKFWRYLLEPVCLFIYNIYIKIYIIYIIILSFIHFFILESGCNAIITFVQQDCTCSKKGWRALHQVVEELSQKCFVSLSNNFYLFN